MKSGLILVEGLTEERFVTNVLGPHLTRRNLWLTPKTVTTKVVPGGKNRKGGVGNYRQIERDLRMLLKNPRALVTTLIDYYGLPPDTPGMRDRAEFERAEDRVRHVEGAVFKEFGEPSHFVPFFMLHEFEACLFVDSEITAGVAGEDKSAAKLANSAGGCEPEEINEGRDTAPSKRLINTIPSFIKQTPWPDCCRADWDWAYPGALPSF